MNQGDWACPNCGVFNNAQAPACSMCQMGRPVPQNQMYQQQPPPVYQQQPPQQQPYQQQPYQQQQPQQQPYQQQSYQQQQPPQQQQQYQQQPPQQQQQNYGQEAPHKEPLHTHETAKEFENGEIDYTKSVYRDKFWAILFLVHIAGMVALFFIFRSHLEKYTKPPSTQAPVQGQKPQQRNDTVTAVVLIFASVVASVLWAVAWIAIMKRFASAIIKITFFLVVVFHIAVAIVAVAFGTVIGAIIALVFLALFLLYAYHARKRIPFATVMLEMSTQCIQDHPGPVNIAFAMTGISFLWSVFWVLTVLVVTSALGDQRGIGIFLLLVSYYWTLEVLANVIHVTASGVSASWYFVPETKNPTQGAFKRATTTSFGSICFGSLLIAIVRAIRAMLDAARESGDNQIIVCIVDCILGCLETILEYLNLFAFAQVAIYGKDFWTAAKDTFQLFKSRGFDAIVNDDLTGFVLVLGAIIGGLAAGLIGGLGGRFSGKIDSYVAVGIICFFVGFFIVQLILRVVRSFVTTFFVCFAEDPETLARTHPSVNDRVIDAIREMHGHSYDNHFAH